LSDLEKILLTIIGGVIVFVTGQLISKFLIEPIQELRKAIGEVRFNLAYYSTIIHTPISRDKEQSGKAYDAITKNWSDLLTKAHAIPLYKFLPRIFVLPQTNIDKAAIHLRALATYIHETNEKAESHIEEVNRRVECVEKQLRLRPLE
jgi:hypothetical protein